MNNQQTMLYQGVLIPRPVLNVDLHVLPDFTGRVVVHIENGRVICDRQLFDDEHICTLATFIEMAREMELRFEGVAGGTDSVRIPERVHLQALQVLLRYRRRRIFPRRMRRTGYLSLKVNPRWRLLSKDDGRNWEVMSHETYNREKDR